MTAVANDYGNVDVRKPIPQGYTHIRGPRLGGIADKLGVEWFPAMTGFRSAGRFGWQPEYHGIVVARQDRPRVIDEMKRMAERREARAAQKARAARRRRDYEVNEMTIVIASEFPGLIDYASEIADRELDPDFGGGRTSTHDETTQRARDAAKNYILHNYTYFRERLDARPRYTPRADWRIVCERDSEDELRDAVAELTEDDSWQVNRTQVIHHDGR